MERLVRLFRRETTSTEFIPVIDGLRFLAIAMVVLFHADAYIKAKSSGTHFSEGQAWLMGLTNNFVVMGQGVTLFFVISGFILAVPFLRYYLGLSEKKPLLRAYFFRRLTRLEPPYIIATILIFLVIVFIVGSTYPLSTLIASLFSSLLYIHTLVFPGEFPYLNSVTWSLEIEVQYYILAPFLMWGLCQLKDKVIRRTATLGLIVVFASFGWLIDVYGAIKIDTLFSFLQYFLSGILLCDVFLLDREKLAKLDNPSVFVLGLLLLWPIVGIEHSLSPFLALRVVSPLMILGFYLIVFGNRWWNRMFSLNALTLIGGMCYSIYLLHNFLISGIGRLTIGRIQVDNFLLYYVIQIAILLLGVLAVSSVYFLLIEKPCMRRDWHIKLYEKFRGMAISGTKSEVENTI